MKLCRQTNYDLDCLYQTQRRKNYSLELKRTCKKRDIENETENTERISTQWVVKGGYEKKVHT